MFLLCEVPTELRCPECGCYVKDLRQDEAFEVYTSRLLCAKIPPVCNKGFDVYDSEMFPGLTFQVKCANAREGRKELKAVKGRDLATWDESPHWTWFEKIAGGADIYVLYGVMDGNVLSFVVPLHTWLDESYDTGNGGRILRISTDEYSHCGRYRSGFKRNKFWQYRVKTWPNGLFEVIEYYAKCQALEQVALF